MTSGLGFDVLFLAFAAALFVVVVILCDYGFARLEHWVQHWAGDIPVRERPDDYEQAAWVVHERQVQLDRSMRRKP